MAAPKFLLLLLLLLPLLSFSLHSSSSSPDYEPDPFPPPDGVIITESDLQALLAIKDAFLDPLHALRSWNSSYGACQGSWLGVKCAQGQVIALQLPSKQLSGSLSPQVGQLLSLRKLNLHSNAIRGAIPSSLSMLPNLRGLYLNKNQFSGSIPIGLANSPFLQRIDLSHNSLSGSVPPFVSSPSSSSSSSRLCFIDFSHNLLSSPLPASSFTSLSSLLELHISHNALQGTIPSELAQRLPSLSILDLSHNQLNGSFPPAFLPPLFFSNLSFLDLSYNSFAGSLPADLGNLTTLQVLNVSNNEFSSVIPAHLGNLTRLQALDLSDNMFNGTIPSSLAALRNLSSFNCSFNELTGSVPGFVHRFGASSFEGNAGLCGYDASVACTYQAPPPRAATVTSSPSNTMVFPHQSADSSGRSSAQMRRFGTASFLIVVIGGVVAGILAISLFAVLICIFYRRYATASSTDDKASTTGSAPSGKAGAAHMSEADNGPKKSANSKGAQDYKEEFMIDDMDAGGGKLVHFDGGLSFTADGLLCATAEVLGKSSYGTVYKATFDDGSEVAVKRLRDGIVKSQKDFEAEVNVLGKIRHPNLLPLRGYYWGPKNEKLLIFDFMPGGSLAAFLHARGPETPLTWQTRLNIAAGAARGLAHLHETERLVHGNLTSGNILLDGRMNAKLSDFGLARLMTAAANANVIATASALGYRAPELTKLRKATTRSDVYSFGIVLLELLTGKSPADAASGDQTAGLDLPQWVASVVKEEWTNEIFDLELMKGCAPSEDDLISTLQLAMNCVAPAPSGRPSMEEVDLRLQDLVHGNKPGAAAGGQENQYSRNTTSSDSSV